MIRLPSPAKKPMRYYPSTCPVCTGTALEAYTTPRTVEFQCALCGGYEITFAAKSAMRGMSQDHRETWLAQARRQAPSRLQIALLACTNEDLTGGA